MGRQFPELPMWEFTSTEESPGIYVVHARRDGGIHGDATGSDEAALVDGLRRWAVGVENNLRPEEPSP